MVDTCILTPPGRWGQHNQKLKPSSAAWRVQSQPRLQDEWKKKSVLGAGNFQENETKAKGLGLFSVATPKCPRHGGFIKTKGLGLPGKSAYHQI